MGLFNINSGLGSNLIALKLTQYLVPILLLSGCVTYKVRDQNNEITSRLTFPCGYFQTELRGKGNSSFTFWIEYKIKDTIFVATDSIQVWLNSDEIDYKITNSKNRNILKSKMFGEGEFGYEFDTGRKVFTGDSIKVYAKNWLICKDKAVSMDTATFAFINALRIEGVNYEE